jgi:Methyl-accepting chemotaxis protein (MCP) signalling domain
MQSDAINHEGQTDQEMSTDSSIESIVDLSRRMQADVLQSVQHITEANRAAQILSMNARIEAAHAGSAGAGFAVVAQELTRLSAEIAQTTRAISARSRETGDELNFVIERLATQVRDNRLCALALTNIDVIDRNLYERSCDVRWWATDSAIWNCVSEPTAEARAHASRRLGQILDSYTVYFDLVLADLSGRIVANGRPSLFNVVGQNVVGTQWFRAALATDNGSQYGFQSVESSPLVNGKRALVYSCTVREEGVIQGKLLGVLGILFAWDPLGQTVIRHTPLSAQEWKSTRACICDETGLLLADSDGTASSRHITFDGMQKLLQGPFGAITTVLDGRNVSVAHAASPGYETYRTGWHSLLIRSL